MTSVSFLAATGFTTAGQVSPPPIGSKLPPLESLAPPRALSLPLKQADAVTSLRTADGQVVAGGCSDAKANIAKYAAKSAKTVTCIDIDPNAKKLTREDLLQRVSPNPTAIYPGPEVECALAGQTNTWFYSRQFMCLIMTGVRINTIDPRNGAPLGYAIFTINHAIGLDARAATFSNFTSFYLESQSGIPSNLVTTQNSCNCTGISIGDPIGGERIAPTGTPISGRINFSDNPAAGQIHNGIIGKWIDGFRPANGTPAYLQYAVPASIAIRCDAQANTGGAQGCTVPAYTPYLQLPGYGSGQVGTAFFYWFSYSNVDHWGQYPNGKPLTRFNNPIGSEDNRKAMCNTGAWKRDALVPDDSCDEFPLAATNESGALLGIPPTRCSQARFTFNSDKSWTAYPYAGYTTSQRCALGHTPVDMNTAIGTQYSNLIQNQRVLDKDPFWIQILL